MKTSYDAESRRFTFVDKAGQDRNYVLSPQRAANVQKALERLGDLELNRFETHVLCSILKDKQTEEGAF